MNLRADAKLLAAQVSDAAKEGGWLMAAAILCGAAMVAVAILIAVAAVR